MPVGFTHFLNMAFFASVLFICILCLHVSLLLLLLLALLLLCCYPQGSVATHVRCGVVVNNHFTANLLENFPLKGLRKSVKI